MNYITFDDQGRLLDFLVNPQEQPLNSINAEYSQYNPITNYIVLGTLAITPRPTQLTALDKLTLTADGSDAIVISDAPSGTFTATNTITRETVTGSIAGTDTFSTTVPGTYRIKIESWPYLDFETTITAVAP